MIRIKEVYKNYGKYRALEGVSLTLEKGEAIGLVGLNGAGKTTLLKILTGLLLDYKGEVSIAGFSPRDEKARALFFYLPEKFALPQNLKGKEYLRLTLGLYGKKISLKEMKDAASLLDFDPLALEKKISEYSKGMQQKLMIMSALLSDREVYILDEPMSGLDPAARKLFMDVLEELKTRGKTILFSTHILSDVERVVNGLAVLHKGKLLFKGTLKEFLESYGETLETAFLKCINFQK